jgi:phytol kinase
LSFEPLISLRPWLGIALTLAWARGLLATLNVACRRCPFTPELARKALHIGMGTIFMLWPWLFGHDLSPAWLLAACFVGLLLAGQLLPPLRYHVAGVIYAADRSSVGEYCFPIAAAVLYTLSAGDPMLFCVPLALLTYADAMAALVGARYGTIRFRTPGGRKSFEGCTAFAVCAFLLTHVPLLLAARVTPLESLLIAASVALLCTAVEAGCWSGLDNLAVPMMAFVLLRALPGHA